MRSLLAAAVLFLPSLAAAQLALEANSELGGGFDSNPYLDAFALPALERPARGSFIRVTPGVVGAFGPATGHMVWIAYGSDLRPIFLDQGPGELRIEHGGELGYATAPIAGFHLRLVAAAAQLYFRTMPEGGYTNVSGRIELHRALGRALSGALAYTATSLFYPSGELLVGPERELAHEIRTSLAWRIAPGLVAEPAWAVSLVSAQPEELGSRRHRAGLGARWAPAILPVEARIGYHLLVYELNEALPHPLGKVRAVERLDVLHAVFAETRIRLTDWLTAKVRYEGTIGRGAPAEGSDISYSRHLVSAGLTASWGWGWREWQRGGLAGLKRDAVERHAQLRTGGRMLEVRVKAPGARRVSVIGSFNNWDPRRGVLRRAGGDSWTGSFELPPGHHEYMLKIDDEVRPPPGCQAWAPDGFGGRNCVVRAR